MMFLLLGCLFLAGAIYNLFKGDFREMTIGLILAAVMIVIHLSRKKKAARDTAVIAAPDSGPLHCCKCGSSKNVERRAYLLTYSLIFFTSKSPGAFKPVCNHCRVTAGLPYSFCTFLLGWWGIPWGPIYTVQSIYRNFQGGVVVPIAGKDI